VVDPDGRTRRLTIGGGGLTIGRSEDNDLVARDGRVSRHHGRIAGRRGTLVYQDLASTNGSRVNGQPVTEVVLGVGDRLEVGDTTVVVEGEGAPD
jgi:pSer/pThr/pTyr-binding forkhead associated (FHA) protein